MQNEVAHDLLQTLPSSLILDLEKLISKPKEGCIDRCFFYSGKKMG
jgi:hypothetical protein